MSERVGGAVFRRLSGMRRVHDDRLRGTRASPMFIEHSGHMIPIEAPEAWIAIVADWLKAR